MKILILGASGFLGKELTRFLETHENQILKVGRNATIQSSSTYLSANNPNYLDKIADFNPEIVINAMAAWGSNKSTLEILEGNLLRPLEIFALFEKKKILWVQCNSYFNYWYEQKGTDRDQYSMYKRHFTEIAIGSSNTSLTRIIDLRLPHLTGAKQPKDKIIPQIIHALISQKPLNLSSGNQVIPITHVSNVAGQIQELIAGSGHLVSNYEVCYCPPVAQISLREIVAHLENMTGLTGQFNFGFMPDRTYEDYVNVRFSGKVLNSVQSTSLDLEMTLRDSVEGAINIK